MHLRPSRPLAAGLLALSVAAPAAAQCDIGKLLPTSVGDPVYFGAAVDLHGARAVLGEPYSERAFLFDVSTGDELARLEASDAGDLHYFGHAVATDGALAVVGAYGVDANVGAAYVFDVATGAELHKLVSGSPTYEYAGWSVDLAGDTVAVGAPLHPWLGPLSGAVHLYSASTGQYVRRLLAYDGGPEDVFGTSVALDGERLVVGAPRHDDHFGTDSGAAYVFDVATGQPLLELLPADGSPGAEFGSSVAVHGERAVVGAPGHAGRGRAYLFDLSTGAQLFAWSSPAGNAFGTSVAIEGTTVLVGDYLDDTQAFNNGAVHRFDAATGLALDTLLAAEAQPVLFFSRGGVALSEGRALVSAEQYEDAGGKSVGAAYLYSVASDFGVPYCPPRHPNSAGAFGRVDAAGCDAVLADELTLVARSLPPHQVGYFLASRTQGFVPNVGGGQGHLCLSGNVARFAAQAGSTGPGGELRLSVDLAAIPTNPPSAVAPGETWHFQCWYRDANPGPTSNLTAGLSVLFR